MGTRSRCWSVPRPMSSHSRYTAGQSSGWGSSQSLRRPTSTRSPNQYWYKDHFNNVENKYCKYFRCYIRLHYRWKALSWALGHYTRLVHNAPNKRNLIEKIDSWIELLNILKERISWLRCGNKLNIIIIRCRSSSCRSYCLRQATRSGPLLEGAGQPDACFRYGKYIVAINYMSKSAASCLLLGLPAQSLERSSGVLMEDLLLRAWLVRLHRLESRFLASE